jgi:hypothetical protein
MRYYFLLSRVIHGSAGIVDDSVKVVQIQVPRADTSSNELYGATRTSLSSCDQKGLVNASARGPFSTTLEKPHLSLRQAGARK